MISKQLLKLQKTSKKNYEFLLKGYCNNLSVLIKWALSESLIIDFDSLAVAEFKFMDRKFFVEFDDYQDTVLVQEVIYMPNACLTTTDLSSLLTLTMNTKLKLNRVEGEYSTHLYNEQQ